MLRCVGVTASLFQPDLEVSGERDEQLAAELIVGRVRVGTARLNGDRNHRRILVSDIIDTTADFEVLQRVVRKRQDRAGVAPLVLEISIAERSPTTGTTTRSDLRTAGCRS